MKCLNCNRTVTRNTKFCPHCGEKIVPKTSDKEEGTTNNQKIPFVYAMGFLVVGVLIAYVIFTFNENFGNQSPPPASNVQSTSAIQTAAVLDIAKEFMCFCGTCSDLLDTCKCDHPKGALEVKGFIAQKLNEGHQKPHILEMVKSTYDQQLNLDTPFFNLDSLNN